MFISTKILPDLLLTPSPSLAAAASFPSGNVTIETSFYDSDLFVSKSLVRVFYD